MWFPLLIVTYLIQSVSLQSVFNSKTSEEVEEFNNSTSEYDTNDWVFKKQLQNDIFPYQSWRNIYISDDNKWPNNEIPYMFDKDLSKEHKETINIVLQDFITNSCIIPKLITNPIEDYVLIRTKGCNSNIGRVGGKQIINLSPRCSNRRTILHEFMHALGFHHQHSALERDDYINIHYEVIKIGKHRNFYKFETRNFETEYDYESIMHYKGSSLSKKMVIETKNKTLQQIVGTGTKLSKLDLLKLNMLYNCSEFL